MAVNNLITLDHIKSFFSLDSKIIPLDIAPTVTGGLGIDNTDECPIPEPRISQKDRSTNYARHYIQEEEKALLQAYNIQTPNDDSTAEGGLNAVEELSTAVGDIQVAESLDSDNAQLYSAYYKSDINYDSNLSIFKYRKQILQLVGINQVVIIQGPTGCGKTTQVPQYILDHHVKLGHYCNIIVTQPRKIAAVSIARRVCKERDWKLGGIVGYQVAMDNKLSTDTRISYVTTGVLLQKLVNSQRMDMFTHVILDEVHERDQDTDFALLVVKKLLRTNSKRVKVILMSATIDASIFANYFSLPAQKDPASIIEVEGKSKEVTEHYLQELSALGVQIPVLDPDVPRVPEESYELVLKLMFIFDKIEKAEQNVPVENEYAPVRGTVLIFLPGYDEISVLTNKLKPAAVSRKYVILPLHSTITVEEQTRVFNPPNYGFRKVIISTNIAESSITVPDIKYVIDFCLTKSLVCDQDTNYTSLRLEWASKANCTQRKGRAGRVDIGRVYRMVTREFYENYLAEYNVPEIQRCPLSQTVLFAKKLNFGPPHALLALAIDPPALCDIENAVLLLKQVGALAVTVNGLVSPYDGDLTFIGRVMASLPLDVKISKLIILGYVFNCLEDCIIIAASLSLKSFLAKPFQQLLDSYKSSLSWANGTFSDCLAYLHAYKMWKDFSIQGQFSRPGGNKEEIWAKQNFIQLRRIKEVDMLVEEIKKRLAAVNIMTAHHGRQGADPNVETLILKIVIGGAFFPCYFLQNPIEEKDILKQISNGDPMSTVYVTGLPKNHGLLYFTTLHEMFSVCSNKMSIEFEERKAYIHFGRRMLDEKSHDQDSCSILPAVYFAVKMRDLRMPLILQVFSYEDAERKMEQLRTLHQQQNNSDRIRRLSSNRMTVQDSSQVIERVALPAINQLVINIFITHVLNCGHFWARYTDQKTQNEEVFIRQALNLNGGRNLKPLPEKVTPGMFVIAPYSEGNSEFYYRATVEEVNEDKVVVFFIDYGNSKTLPISQLRHADVKNFPELYNIKAMAFECQLSGVKPSAVKSGGLGWSQMSKNFFVRKISGQILNARVYSVVQGIVRLELYEQNLDQPVSINMKLVKEGYAEEAEESLLSKQNYEERAKAESISLQLTEAENKPSHFTPSDLMESAVVRKTSNKVRLHGPYSPLETSFSGMTYLDQSRVIKINRDSVNSVSLNAEPQDKHQQLLVASSVTFNEHSNSLSLRNTTLLPKIRDLSSFLCLIFAPAAEYRTDPKRTAYTGALCGLGCDPSTGEPLYHDHDMEITFESEIDHQDINEINKIRMGINLTLGNEDELAEWSQEGIAAIQKKLRRTLLNVVRKQRKLRDPYCYPKSHRWMQVPNEYLLEPDLEKSGDNPYVLPLHRGINLCEDKSLHNEMLQHAKELYRSVGRSLEPIEKKCCFCNITLPNPRALLLHLDTSEHKKREEEMLKR